MSGGGGAGASGGGGGGAGGSDDPINAACPVNGAAGPYVGQYAMKGMCCYRTSNSSRLNATPGMATLEYRLSYFNPINHPKTISGNLIVGATVQRFEKEEQHLLFRFKVPYENGEFKAGKGTAMIGPGRYNCDGTYSFYSEKAATPSMGVTDAKRWASYEVELTVDPSKPTWEEQSTITWATNVNRRPSYLPYTLSALPKTLEWEAASQGFDVIEMPPLKDALNCVGTRPNESSWDPDGKTVSYQRLDLNDKSAITVLGNISLAHLQAFGATGDKDDPKYDPNTAPRCQIGSQGCIWQKLPDSLCPVTETEMNSWGCHVGDPANEDKVTTNCTMTAPTGVLDPDKGATSEGQCCDPMALPGQTGKDGLPGCNAYRLVSEFVAGGVEITDELKDSLQPDCEK